MQSESKVYVIIAVYNEAKYLARFLDKLKLKTQDFIIVDDGSVDKSAEIAKRYSKNVLIHPVNLGKGAAMKTGADYAFKYLNAKAVIFMDGDDQHDPEDLKKFYTLLEQQDETELIFGIRPFNKNMPYLRILGNRSISFLVKLLFGFYIADIPSGFKAMNEKAYKKLRWSSTGYGVELEIACKTAKFKIPFKEVSIKTIYHDLDRGMDLPDTLKVLYKIVSLRINL